MEDRERRCLLCLKAVVQDEWHVHDGTEFRGAPTYGSGFDSVLQDPYPDWPDWDEVETPRSSSRVLSVVICDECLSKADHIEVLSRCVTEERREKHTSWADSQAAKAYREHQEKKGE